MKKTLPLAAACLLAALPRAHADDDALRPIAYLSGVTQETLGTETAELAASIDALMAELQRNGFPAQSLEGLRQLVAQLGELGGRDMTAIAERLRGLGEDPSIDARETVTGAYVAQQALEGRLKALAKKIAVRQLREETVRRLEALIARQLAVQRETRAIAAAQANGSRQQLLVADQRGVGEDLEGFFQTGETLLTNLRETTTPAAATPAATAAPGFMDRVNGPLLNTYAAEALERLEKASYGEAFARQNALLAELNKILQGILSSQTKEERLASALMQVAALRQEQEARDQADKKPDAEEAQAAADEAKLLAAKVAAVDQEAARAVQAARDALQEAADEAAADASRTAQNPPANPPATPPATSPETTPATPAGEPPATTPPTNSAGTPEAENDGAQLAGQPTPPPTPPQGTPPGTAPETPSGESPAGENGDEQLASTPPAAPPPGAAEPGAPGDDPAAAQPTPARPEPSAAAAALAAAEASLRRQLASEQARENAAAAQANAQDKAQANAQASAQANANAQTPPQDGSPQGPDSSRPSLRDTPGSEGGGAGFVENQSVDGDPGSAQAVGALNRSEREAMASLQNERYPAEYAPWVQQYWRNLAQEK